MNIFATSNCPKKSARYLDDKRVIKMILESAQILSTAINYYGGNGPYKTTHVNHPCNIWVRQSRANYLWLKLHFQFLCSEYTKRFGKTHKSEQYYNYFTIFRILIPNGELTEFPNCTTFKEENDVHLAYQKYLAEKWRNDKRPAVCRIGG